MSFGIYISLKFLFLFIRVLIGVNILCTIILYGPTQYLRREARLVVHWTLPYKMTLGRPRPNSKPFQIPTEDNSLFLSLSPFSHFSFFKNSQSFHTTHSVLEEGSKVGGHWSLLWLLS